MPHPATLPHTILSEGPVTEATLRLAIGSLADFCSRYALATPLPERLYLVAEELLTNNLRHQAGLPLHLTVDAALCLHLHTPEQWQQLPSSKSHAAIDDPLRPLGGLGWVLIQHYMAVVEHRCAADGTHLILQLRA